jgi:hypothetical protein
MVLLLIGLLGFQPGKTYRLPPAIALSSGKMARACVESGTRCSVYLHSTSRNIPERLIQIELLPIRADQLIDADKGLRQQLHREASLFTPNFLVSCNRLQQVRQFFRADGLASRRALDLPRIAQDTLG